MSDVLIHHYSKRLDDHIPAFSEKFYPKRPKACHFPQFLTFFPLQNLRKIDVKTERKIILMTY